MKTQILTFFGSRKAIPLIFLISLSSSPIYAVSNDNHLFFSVSELLQDTKQKPTIKLSGTVKDSFGALGGVIVTVGTTVVTTDLEGKYTTYITSGDRITFSMMGYKDQSMVYSGGSVLNITLIEDTSTLDEIVVNAGYYTVKDRERTGNIARVTAKDIELQPVLNPIQALQGRMAGVNITQYSGTPGGGFNVQIRGKNSLNLNANDPLYIIDGIPNSINNLSTTSMSASILPARSISPLNSINPSDIESIEILKDADATAIYGSRGANGVVLITTKKGKKNSTDITLNTSTTFSNVAKKMKLLTTEEFNQMRKEAFLNDGITSNYPYYAYDMNGTWDKTKYTDWQKELIGKTAIGQNTQLSISSGNYNNKFLLSLNHSEQSSVFPTDKKFTRKSLSFNYNHTSENQKFTFSTSTNYSELKNDLIQTDLTSTALNLAPIAPSLFKEDGSLNWDYGVFGNPIAPMQATYDYKNRQLILNANLGYNIFENLSLKLSGGLTTTNFEENKYTPHTIYDPANNYTSAQSSVQKGLNNASSYIIEPQISYIKKINDLHEINFLVGSTFQSTDTNMLSINASNFSSNLFLKNIGSAKTKTISSTGNTQYKYASIFSRLNYKYSDKYIANITARRDGSSRFGDKQKFGNFGAIGIAWIFSNENFLKNLKWLDFGKIRTSYGITGSDNIGDYQYLDTYTIGTNIYDGLTELLPSRLLNPNYSWEQTNKLEAALELSLFNNSINTTLAWYRNKSANQLIGVPLPYTTGFPSIQDNLKATVLNTGWEFSINTNNIKTNNWYWTTNFNISFPKNKLLEFPNLEGSTFANNYVVGKSLSIKKLYNLEGVDPITGLYKFTDYNNDGKLTAIEDKQIIKSTDVEYHGGIANTVQYKNFTLDFLFQFVKQSNLNYNSVIKPGALFNQPRQLLDRWSESNPHSQYSYYTSGLNSQLNELQAIFKESNKTFSDASYIRLKNVSLTYQFSIPKARIKTLRIYVLGQNLWTITNYFGLDPEFLNLGYLPPLRTYSFGIQLTL